MKKLFFAIAIAATAFAYGQEKIQTLTLKEAVKMGLANNVTLNQQENNLISSRVNKTSSLLNLGPSVEVNGNAGRNDGNSFNQQQGIVVNGTLDFINASIDASMPLFRGMSVVNNARRASNQYESQLNVVKRSSQDLIRAVAFQYLTCLLDRELVFINERNVETQRKQLEQIRGQVSAGARAEVDARNQEYQVKNAELLLVRAQNTLRNDKAVLARSLPLDPSISFELEEPDWQMTSLDNLAVDELYALALANRSDLRSAEYGEKAARFGYMSQKGGYFPTINIFASYGSRYNYIHPTENFVFENRNFAQQFAEDNTQLTYGVSFRIPIHGGFQNRSFTVREKMNYENAKLTKQNTELTVKNDVLLVYQNLQDAKTSYAASQAQLEAAQISNNLERERYALGISDIVAVTLSNQTLTRAEADYQSARYTLMFQTLLVNYATGVLKFEDIP